MAAVGDRLGGSEVYWQLALDLVETGEFTWSEAVDAALELTLV